jgi:hypothetical protein
MDIQVPQNLKSTFEQLVVKKLQKDISKIDHKKAMLTGYIMKKGKGVVKFTLTENNNQ